MKKIDLLRAITNKVNGATQKDVAVILEAYEEVVRETLAENIDEKVPLGKLGSFKGKQVEARDGVSAITGKPWHKDAHKEICFKFGKDEKMIATDM